MEQKNALHINSYFLSNKIHYNFFKVITKYRQDKFLIPVYKSFKENHIGGMSIDYVFSGIDKKLFFTKIFKVLHLFYKKNLNHDVEYIHAHTLISDGIPAYIISLITKKRYVVTVRGTDVNYYIARSSLFRSIANVILSNASIVFFVSPSYRERIKSIYPELDSSNFLLLPNGIDAFWGENIHEKKVEVNSFDKVNLLFVGRVTKQKNIELLLDFLRKYDDRLYTLTIVGPNTLNWDFDVLSQTVKEGNTINYVGEVKDMNKLLSIYRSNDIFVMLSPSETFGVVYIEALTQGLPILYTRGDGIDGYFEEGEVGYSCDHRSLEELKEKIDMTLARYTDICRNTGETVRLFEWDHLVKQYINNVNAAL